MQKAKIPKALREQVWIAKMGKKFESKCRTSWCTNKITVFDFQCGHDIPESFGGETTIYNLIPICARCNLSMSNTYTFKEWTEISQKPTILKRIVLWLFKNKIKSSAIKEYGTKLIPSNTNQNLKL